MKPRPFIRKTVIVKRDDGKEYRFKIHNDNEIWMSWWYNPFPCRLELDGRLTMLREGLQGTGKPMIGWTWRADDHSTICPDAQF